jgi:hypothetical protein
MCFAVLVSGKEASKTLLALSDRVKCLYYEGKGEVVPVLSTMPWKCMSNIDVVKLHTLTSALDGGD